MGDVLYSRDCDSETLLTEWAKLHVVLNAVMPLDVVREIALFTDNAPVLPEIAAKLAAPGTHGVQVWQEVPTGDVWDFWSFSTTFARGMHVLSFNATLAAMFMTVDVSRWSAGRLMHTDNFVERNAAFLEMLLAGHLADAARLCGWTTRMPRHTAALLREFVMNPPAFADNQDGPGGALQDADRTIVTVDGGDHVWCGHLACDVGYACDMPVGAPRSTLPDDAPPWCGHLACDVGYACDGAR
jgi:hypothetical protein